MLAQRWVESLVGFFILLAIIALAVLAFRVSGLTHFLPEKTYSVTADFDDIGGLKPRAAVKIDGVQIGEVSRVALNQQTFKAVVTLQINDRFNQIPNDSSASILTAGLLGDNYIQITPMYSQTFLKNGDRIAFTTSAMILEKLIGQFMYQLGKGNSSSNNNHK